MDGSLLGLVVGEVVGIAEGSILGIEEGSADGQLHSSQMHIFTIFLVELSLLLIIFGYLFQSLQR